MALSTTRGVLLRSYAYGDSSLIFRFFTRDLGVLGVMAKGARGKGSKGGGGLETFAGGDLTVHVKETRDLQTLKYFTADRPRSGLGRNVVRFGAASVVGELVLRHGGEAASPELFARLEEALDLLEEADEARLVPILLARAWGLVSAMGYHPELLRCVACAEQLGEDEMARFDYGAGGVRCSACSAGVAGPRIGPGGRSQIGALLGGRTDPVTRPRAHLRLLGDFVTYHVSGSRPLASLRVLEGLLR